MRAGATRSPLPWLGTLILLYLAVPVVAFCVRLAGTDARGFHDPGLFPALWTSVVAACISTAVITLLGVPLAYVLARSKSRLASLVGLVVQLPLAIPPVMGGVLLIYLVGPYTWLGRLFDGALTESLTGVVLAQTFVAAPFLIVTARAAFATRDPALDGVAATLGHGELGRFLRVALPVAAPGIRAGMLLSWLRAFGEYGATVILAYHPTTLPVYTFTQFSATGLPATMAPTALALGVAVCAVGLSRLVVLRHRRRRAPGTALSGAATSPPARAAGAPIGFAVDHRLGGFHLAVAHQGVSQRLAVLGPSGSGKSTLLRCLAGLYGPEPGPVSVGGRRLDHVPVERRRLGYVAQSFGLFPHLTVWEQLLFAVDASPSAAAYWLGALHLDGLEDRLPHELSGGQRQRVALAQALTRGPEVLLLDEPFSALDTPVRRELRRTLRRLQRETGISTVLVTHDPEEAALLADEVIVISDGVDIQRGTIGETYARPASCEAARLLGVANVFGGVVSGPGEIDAGAFRLVAATGRLEAGDPVLWHIVPGGARVLPLAGNGAVGGRPGVGGVESGGLLAARVAGTVEEVDDLGTAVELVVALGGDVELTVRAVTAGDLAPGDRCAVELHAGMVEVWAPASPGAPPIGTPADPIATGAAPR